jgi:hypothetical protein
MVLCDVLCGFYCGNVCVCKKKSYRVIANTMPVHTVCDRSRELRWVCLTRCNTPCTLVVPSWNGWGGEGGSNYPGPAVWKRGAPWPIYVAYIFLFVGSIIICWFTNESFQTKPKSSRLHAGCDYTKSDCCYHRPDEWTKKQRIEGYSYVLFVRPTHTEEAPTPITF